MVTDAQGNRLTGASPKAGELYDQSVAEFQCYRDDPVATIDAAIADSPDFAMAHILRAHLFLSGSEKSAVPAAKMNIAEAMRCAESSREKQHIAALQACVDSEFGATRGHLESVLSEHPRDAAALQMAHLWDFFCGDSATIRDRVARHLPHWSADVPGYHAVLGMQAFGLEEMGEYGPAEDAGRRAVELNPGDAWAQHAVAHVMEMQNRLDDGVAWMRNNEEGWTQGSLIAVHNWWHLGLYFLDLGETRSVLDLYDRHIRGERSKMALDMVDASAMLWRLHMRDVETGARWAELADDWADAVAPGYYAFNDVHATMAFLGAGRIGQAEETLAAMKAALGTGGDNDAMAREIGIPVAAGLIAFAEGDYSGAVEKLNPIRQTLNRFGGSHAQRDVFQLTLVEAAIRSRQGDLAAALVQGRLDAKPESPTNRYLAGKLQAA